MRSQKSNNLINSTSLKITALSVALFILLVVQISAQNIPCEIINDGIDLQTKTYRVELGPSMLFNFTPPEVKNDLQEDNLMKCQAQIVKVEDKISVHLNLRINSLKAQDIYGSIDKEGIMKITLIDGKEIKLMCYAGSPGVQTQNKKAYIYPVGYELSNRDIRQLSKKEIDKIGIEWSSGYEEYLIYEIDFFMNQLACLDRVANQKPN